MKILATVGREDIAVVYIAGTGDGKLIEFTESIQPPLPREEKWVLTVSTLFGCPVRCLICDAASAYRGKLSEDQMISQIVHVVSNRYPDGRVPVKKFKIQFARMGEPSFNENVLRVLELLPELFDAPGLIPSLSSIAPAGTDRFFSRLLSIKKKLYPRRFQLQFSLHTTDTSARDRLIPATKWPFEKIAEYGRAFYDERGRKITLNFALADGWPVDPSVLLSHFDPDLFLIKIVPVNPTRRAVRNNIASAIPGRRGEAVIKALRDAGYEVIPSIGEPEENRIGSNCGQYVTAYQETRECLADGYTYELQRR
ncbi:MAG: radical SAM protein [Chitinivibrionia bacterium]|nr:radical SAM protein [Chitinivibrionia bacterium]